MLLKRTHFNFAQISAKLAKIESEFVSKGGKWDNFMLDNLFEKIKYKKLHFKKSDLPKNPRSSCKLPAITCTAQNNGISCYVPRENATIFKNCISVAANGNAPAFYQPHDFTILQDAYALKFKDKDLKYSHYLYLVTLLQKILTKYDWSDKSGWEKVKLESIKLPTQNGKISFEFMEKYIKELELEKIKEYEKHLLATNLKDCELSEKEKQALNIFTNANSTQSLRWMEFEAGNLFSVRSNPQLNKDSFTFSKNGEYPYFTRTAFNNGILGYVDYLDEKHKIKGGGLAVGMIGMQFFYMEKDFYAGQFTKTCYPKFDNFNKQIAHFFIALLNKNQKRFQSVLVRNFEKEFNVTKIKLPINENGQIAFDFMQNFIKAIEKEVIKGVVLWSQKRINTAKTITAQTP